MTYLYWWHGNKFADTCQTGTVRLVQSAFKSQGTVEVCYENVWGSISSTSWDSNEASVVCKQLGFNGVERKHLHYTWMMIISHVGPSTAYSAAYFGKSISSILFTGLSCAGNETSLVGCSRSLNAIGFTGCLHTQDAGVYCTSTGLYFIHLLIIFSLLLLYPFRSIVPVFG